MICLGRANKASVRKIPFTSWTPEHHTVGPSQFQLKLMKQFLYTVSSQLLTEKQLQKNITVHIIQSDNESEIFLTELWTYFSRNGIRIQPSPPYISKETAQREDWYKNTGFGPVLW